MRILFAPASVVYTDHLPDGEGLIAWHMASGLACRGHCVTVLTGHADLAEPANVNVCTLPLAVANSPWAALQRSRRISKAVREKVAAEDVDVVHWLFPQAADTLLSPYGGGNLPFVAGPMDWPWPRAAQTGFKRALRLAASQLKAAFRTLWLRRVDVLLIAVPGVPVPAGLNKGRRIVVPFGVDLPVAMNQGETGSKQILVVGRLEAFKGIFDALQAFSLIARDFPETILTFVGSGTAHAELRREIAVKQLDGRVELIPHLDHASIPAALAKASVVVCASHGEPFGMSVLEAMASATPVIATAAGGPKELVADGVSGYLFDVGDSRSLSLRLSQLLSDQDLRSRMGLAARGIAARKYSWDVVLSQLEAAYEVAISEHRR